MRTEDDLARVIQLARESGLATLERAATHNLGEHRLAREQLDEALKLARRGLALQSQSGEGITRIDRLLLSRVLAARGDIGELAAVLATFVDDAGLGEEDVLTIAVLDAIARDDRAALRAAIANTVSVYLHLRLELGALAARRDALTDEQREQLRTLAAVDPLWSARSAQFGA